MPASPPTPALKVNAPNIADHLTAAITSGHFKLGALLPTELELCRHYGTSRHTVRAALARLQQLGLVSRRKNVGTRVVATRPSTNFRPALATVDDLGRFGADHRRVVRSVEHVTAARDIARDLGCAEGAPWLRISSLRLAPDPPAMPVGWTDVYIDPRYAEIADLVRASPDTLISALIEAHDGRQIAQIYQEVQAFTLADRGLANLLRVEPGSSALKILRRYYDAQGDMFEASVSVHPADRFSVSMWLRR